MINENLYQLGDETAQVLDRMEISAVNYPTLMEAMGSDKYRVFNYGEGLKSIPRLQKELSENGFTDATYSIGTFTNERGFEETSLFVEQTLAGSRVIFELEIKSFKQLIYNLYSVKHLYVVGKEGVTADLTEELGSEARINICPSKYYPVSYVDPKTNTLYLSDLRKATIGYSSTGLPVFLHEIGHYKHTKAEPELYSKDSAKRAIQILGILGLTRKELDIMVEENNLPLLKPLLKVFESHGPTILKQENIASLWASRWIEQKRLEGADFWKPENESFWEQLDVSMATYRLSLCLDDEIL